MNILLFLVAAVLVIAIVVAAVQKLVKMAITAAVVLFLGLTAWYLVKDNAPPPVADRMETAADKVKAAGAKAAVTVGHQAAEVGRDVGARAATEAKEVGARAAGEVKEAAAKAGDKVVDAAAQGVKDGVKEVVGGQPAK